MSGKHEVTITTKESNEDRQEDDFLMFESDFYVTESVERHGQNKRS
jgi:hypothetical protein